MKPSSILSEVDLIVTLKLGKEGAFTEIYNQYWAGLYLYIRRMFPKSGKMRAIVQ
ncbi:hypothetical protein [Pedobacter psychrodurus]|uniref:hypothetical protein n=1 Tax=Pedobacter psychrodurus TaxID=2530456 RepID=UPI0029318BAA|nr:hypothetical protein [Pedobacter psychrodurus]